MADPITLAIAGASGRMGQALVRCAMADTAFTLVGACEAVHNPNIGETLNRIVPGAPTIEIVSEPKRAAATADVWIDFTVPGATLSALADLDDTGVSAVIIGTTGFSESEEQVIRNHGASLAIVKAGNFSLGVNLLVALTRQAAARLGPDWDIEILETHHRHKVDAPSGTALMLGEAAADGRGHPLDQLRSAPYDGITGARSEGEIGFSVRRSGGVIGEHEVSFGSDEEILSLSHTALNRDIFAKGALYAAKFAVTQTPGLYNMADVLDL